jgi:biopolymer transport protein TolR
MPARRRTRSQLITRINVTPIIDVALVLVIILLVTAPMFLVSNVPVDLPQAATREAEDERNVCVTLAGDGQLSLDDTPVTHDALQSQLAARLREPGNDQVLVVVRADAHASYASVRGVLEEARAAGAQRLAIATRQKVRPAL